MPTPAALLLTPGAGADASHRTLVAVAAALEGTLAVRRTTFPNRAAGKRAPDRPEAAVAHIRTQAEHLAAGAHVPQGAVLLGGRSFGGRMCSLTVAQGFPAAGLVLLSYPLHPPGKPERLRVEHLPEVKVPVLVVQGQRDPFGTPEEIAEHFRAVAGPVTVVAVPGNHAPTDDQGVARAVRDWVAAS